MRVTLRQFEEKRVIHMAAIGLLHHTNIGGIYRPQEFIVVSPSRFTIIAASPA